MKQFIFMVLTVTVLTKIVKGQDATILSGGDRKSVSIKNYSLIKLNTSGGEYEMSKIDSVLFGKKSNQYNSLYKTLEEAGVKYAFTESIIRVDAIDQPVDVSVDKFRKERTIGKVLQLTGMLVTALAFQADDGQSVAIAGAVIGAVGFAIDIGAGRHLRLAK